MKKTGKRFLIIILLEAQIGGFQDSPVLFYIFFSEVKVCQIEFRWKEGKLPLCLSWIQTPSFVCDCLCFCLFVSLFVRFSILSTRSGSLLRTSLSKTFMIDDIHNQQYSSRRNVVSNFVLHCRCHAYRKLFTKGTRN